MRKLLITLVTGFLLSIGHVLAQVATISGQVTDAGTNQPIEGLQVKAFVGPKAIAQARTSADGRYTLNINNTPVTLDSLVAIGSGGYTKQSSINVKVSDGANMVNVNYKLTINGKVLYITIDDKLNNDPTTNKTSKNTEELRRASLGILGTIGADNSKTSVEGGVVRIGGDNGGSLFSVDGDVQGYSPNLAPNSIAEISVITGGISSEFGDLTGGVISITTRGMTPNWGGSLEARTSQYMDAFGYNFLQGTLGGPLLYRNSDGSLTRFKEKKGDMASRPILGIFLSGNAEYRGVDAPPAIDMYRVKDDVMADLRANPLVKSPLGEGYASRANFITMDDLEKTRVKENTANILYNMSGKVSFSPTSNLDIRLSMSGEGANQRAYIYTYNLFNSEYNPQVIRNTQRYNLFITQRFPHLGDSNALIRNASYTISANYSTSNSVTQDADFEDNFFRYGYIGRFRRNYQPNYTYTTDTINGKVTTSNYLQGFSERGVGFTRDELNPYLANYNEQFFREAGELNNFAEVQSQGGLLNGQTPPNIYSIWSSVGARYPAYNKALTEQIFINVKGRFEIKGHRFMIGGIYQQNTTRSYSVNNATGLWTLARQLTNRHLTVLDKNNPIPVYAADGSFADTVNYNYLVTEGTQSSFDRNLRNSLIEQGARDDNGRLIGYQSIINLDRYGPDELKLSYFSADDLLNQGNGYVSYYGYDYLGNRVGGKPGLSDWLDPNKRTVGAFQPIYVAGYIEDQFSLDRLSIRVGLRVDRYDANQPVVADPYSLYPIREKGEVKQLGSNDVVHPANIDDNYKVYVDDVYNPTKVVGYRNGDQWYDATGATVADPTVLANATNSGRIQPYLVARNDAEAVLSAASFTDYSPTTYVMPRLSFGFPLNEKSSFYAYYDVLTKRPSTGNQTTYDDYFFLQQRATLTIPNPALRPERRTNYEIGYKQKISDNSSINFSAYYGEISDLIQRVQINQAYPITYTTFGNIDFGTVKGYTFGYRVARLGGISANAAPNGPTLSANYTLQFADGTGSNAGTAAALINAGQPNLRTPFPLDYDVRHQINGIFDFRFGGGNNYLGDGFGILKNAGVNFIFNARSGTPYSRQNNVTVGEGIQIGVANRSSLAGSLNGSRLPWQFRLDARIDKDIYWFKKDNQGKIMTDNKDNKIVSKSYVNVFVFIQNVLDARNIVNVYRFTGLPTDDGYLNSQQGQREASQSFDPEAFADQYMIKVNNPDNFINPRFIRVGALWFF